MINFGERKIISSCHTCRNPVYEGEPIYSSSKIQSSGYGGGSYGGKRFEQTNYQAGVYGGYYRGNHTSENWAQCSWCYDQWQAELAKNRSFWWKWSLGGLLLSVILTVLSIIFFPGLEEVGNVHGSVPWYRVKIFSLGSWKITFIAIIVLVVSIFLTGIIGNFLQPPVDRYKLRKRIVKS